MTDIVTAALLVIGDEILSGRTKDKNIGHVAEVLNEAGIRLEEVRVVADVTERIIAAVDALRGTYDYVFTTGGIGPTHDDITADAIARAFNLSIDVDPRALALMKTYYDGRGMELTEARLRMARIPAGAELVDNPVSIAPGFMVANVIVMAGVPNIMQAMLAGVLPRLRKGRPMRSLTLDVRQAESSVAAPLRETQAEFPDVPMGSYPYVDDGRYCTNLVLRSPDPDRLAGAVAALRQRLAAMGISPASEL